MDTTSETVNEISWYYAELQRAYRNWAKQFGSRGQVMQWMNGNGIKRAEKVRDQPTFNLLSSDWNRTTIPVLYKVAPQCAKKMKGEFTNLFQSQSQVDIKRIWYLLFFIHPGRHELWYFEEPPKGGIEGHFPQGYPSRLAWLLRSHRQGLKAAKTYLNGKGAEVVCEAIGNSCVKAYSTVAFRHVHLHPTTIQWQVSGIDDLCATIRGLKISADALSSQEQSVAMALSKRANFTFYNWIDYAQCAINEGPIFLLKEGKLLSDCFRDTVQVLNSERISQSVLRDILKRYHIVEE